MNPLETYLRDMRDIRSTGASVAETSFYPALSNLLNEIGKTLKPKVRCVINPANTGAGIPDGGLFTADQFQKATDAAPMQGQLPARGVVEVKGPADDVPAIARSEQVKRYSAKYGIVLVTNYRDFLLLGRDAQGNALPMEGFTLAETEAAFWKTAAHPQKTATEQGERFCEYVKRIMLSVAPLSAPADVAWFLASYARDAKARIEGVDLPALASVREALEEALGMKFTGQKGEHFFRSTLVQTIFYGVFSAWVLWHRERPTRSDAFNWRESAWTLRVPFISALYEQVATAGKLGPLGLVEVLDWTAAALNRVDRAAFFQRFQDEHAVQYFYEPFLEAFDPELRKELGVWYTPPEIVQYQVARVDTVLREELGLPDGLADPNVVVLDPCCGTGAYLVEVLKSIAETLKAKGGDALIASDLKKAAITRVFGFEILPSPFVVSHLQLGLMLHDLGAPLSAKTNERVGVYLTNALTGWEPPKNPKNLLFSELQAERDAAEKIKREARVLVILGNPPYNAFAGVSPDEEQGLVEPYKKGLNTPPAAGGWGIKKFNLDDLYIRFFRLAERRIAEMTGKGVVSFISNFSYLSDPSFVVMRQRFLSEFDELWFDCLNGDSRETGKLTPDGKSDPSIFSTQYNREGIRVGTAIGLVVRKEKRDTQPTVRFRHLWGVAKRQDLLASLAAKDIDATYTPAEPSKENRYSFRPEVVSVDFRRWPMITALPEVPPTLGVLDNRQEALIRIHRGDVQLRAKAYLDPRRELADIAEIVPELTKNYARFQPSVARKRILAAEGYVCENIRKLMIRPFDTRWCYFTSVRPIWTETRPRLVEQCWQGNMALVVRNKAASATEGMPLFVTKNLGMQHAFHKDAYYIPIRLGPSKNGHSNQGTMFNVAPMANLSAAARAYLRDLGLVDVDAVAQPPSAVQQAAGTHLCPGGAVVPQGQNQPLAKPSSMKYRRNLPHIQTTERPIYVTFCTRNRWVLPESIRNLVLKHCLHDHGKKYWLHSAVIMPDHVHMILSLYRDSEDKPFSLAEVLNGIKGASAHSINKALGRKGSVWQDESFDHILRCSESISQKADYIWNNPVRKGLAASPEQWPWFWGDWMEADTDSTVTISTGTAETSTNSTAEGGCATPTVPAYELIWMHALAVGYSPAYLAENADGIRRDWPRIPLPDTPKALEQSAAMGRQLAALLDTEADVPAVTAGKVEPIFRTIGTLAKVGGGSLDPDAGELAITAGWGHAGKEGVTMPAKGRIVQRPYDKDEMDAIADAAKARGLSTQQALAILGEDTRDVYLNDQAYWRNLPAGVWEFFIGGYQVIKKWLSYREQKMLGRPLSADEAREVTGMARRLAAIILTQPALDDNYRRAAASAYAWPGASTRS